MKEAEQKALPATRQQVGFALVPAGVLTSEWLNAYALVPRRAFLPDDIWPFDMRTGQTVHVSRAVDGRRWQEYADADVPIVTQWDDGGHQGPQPGRLPTSSASMPSVVFRMLDLLTVDEGSRVLEIGTGTGWNAALLAHRAGDDNVVSVEVDAAVAGRARGALDRFGALVEVVHGDGARGAPGHAPFDRTVATCGVREIPFAWVARTRPLGVIVAPWGAGFTGEDALVRLQVHKGGEIAQGGFVGPVEFMKLRAHRAAPIDHEAYVPLLDLPAVEESAEAASEIASGGRFGPLVFALGLRVPDCTFSAAEERDGAQPLWFYSRSDRSWACVFLREGRSARVWQHGPRRLWDEVRAGHAWWCAQGRPEWSRFGLTVGAAGEYVWLDEPGRPV
ncbi:methyltransferase domain-containing protein [Streptomyces sp. NRRL WC-3549]|uniref:methyltransferase domain-containing protein n=1 Tax=Streptomyces sp. NRRL WC-3549 TaxID=1463925 RepID=UPI0004C8475A|nr:methyltransferase domain-containing protein [Streptomyces sp. NRRL WC-3549]